MTEFYEAVKKYFRNNYNAYKLLSYKPIYDDFIEELEAMEVDNIDYGICDDNGDVFSVKKINGKVSAQWR